MGLSSSRPQNLKPKLSRLVDTPLPAKLRFEIAASIPLHQRRHDGLRGETCAIDSKTYLRCEDPPRPERMISPFQTTFAVPMHCGSCVDDVSSAINKLDGITAIEASLPAQTLTVTGTAAPSSIVSAIQSTGRDAILRGSGTSNSAAVSILEDHSVGSATSPVRGLARLVQVSPTYTLIDITLRGLAPGAYTASIRQTGDISRGAKSTGPIWRGDAHGTETDGTINGVNGEDRGEKGVLGEIFIDGAGVGSAFLEKEVRIWEVIGRGMVVAPRKGGEPVVGVIARSAGVWDNEKTVCSCSGKTVWEERGEQVGRGML